MGLIMTTVEDYNNIMLEKARLDRWFSNFLDTKGRELEKDDSYSNAAWKEYKAMLKTYNEVERRARIAYYNVGK